MNKKGDFEIWKVINNVLVLNQSLISMVHWGCKNHTILGLPVYPFFWKVFRKMNRSSEMFIHGIVCKGINLVHKLILCWYSGQALWLVFVLLDSKQHGLWTHNGKIPNSLRPKFRSQSQINIWDVDIKVLFSVEILVD